jgi:phosphate transport system permease protein
MGLVVGLVMIFLLLGLVLVKGTAAVWPRKVVEVQLLSGSPDALQDSLTFGGEVVKVQQKSTRRLDPEAGQPDPEPDMEWQLFVGNKDVYGLAFKYVDADQIDSISQPADVFRIDRMEYGPAFGRPISVARGDASPIPALAPEFQPTLEQLIREAAERRETIREIEKVEIGAINRQLEELRLRQSELEQARDEGREVSAELDRIQSRREPLEARYSELAARARELRARQSQDTLTYQLLSGQEVNLPLGQVVAIHYPNQLGTGERLALMLRNVWVFLSEEPREANTEGGIFPAIFGTFVMTLLMSIAVTPFGVLAAIYLREYASQGVFVRSVRIAVNNLAGVPSIVFGVFGLGFFVYFVGGTIDSLFFSRQLPSPTFGTGGILWASLTLALMTVPVVIVATEEALAAVSRGAREGSLACGASKWQTIQRIILPAAAPGILTGLILAMARGAGEVAPLMLVGVVKLAPDLPLDLNYPFIHLDQKFMHLGFHIYDLGFQSPDSEAAKPMVFATTLLLITLVVVLNLAAIVIRERLRRKYAVGAF